VEFVFTYGLALVAMGLLDAAKKSEEWEKDEAICRERIQQAAAGVARVIVPLCLTLPKKLAKAALLAERQFQRWAGLLPGRAPR
jgi:hypothetical protein